MSGQSVCKMHGGKSPKAIAAAAARETEAAAGKVLASIWRPDAVPVTDNVAEMQLLAGRMKHAVDVLGERLDADDLDGVGATAWLRVLRELRQLLEGMERLGIAGRAVELQQGQAELVLAALRLAFDAVADLRVEQRNEILAAFLAGLRRGQAQGAGVLEAGGAA